MCQYTRQQPGTKSGRRPADKPWINWLSTARQPLVNGSLRSSIGLHMISDVRASEESFKTGVLDALAGNRVGRLLGEPTCRHPVLPRPALPRRPAVRRPAPTRPGYVRFWIRQGGSNLPSKITLTQHPVHTILCSYIGGRCNMICLGFFSPVD